jgi:hypothetical protein
MVGSLWVPDGAGTGAGMRTELGGNELMFHRVEAVGSDGKHLFGRSLDSKQVFVMC